MTEPTAPSRGSAHEAALAFVVVVTAANHRGCFEVRGVFDSRHNATDFIKYLREAEQLEVQVSTHPVVDFPVDPFVGELVDGLDLRRP
jgi:hypothetical protein